jgi:hypothetical protein
MNFISPALKPQIIWVKIRYPWEDEEGQQQQQQQKKQQQQQQQQRE